MTNSSMDNMAKLAAAMIDELRVYRGTANLSQIMHEYGFYSLEEEEKLLCLCSVKYECVPHWKDHCPDKSSAGPHWNDHSPNKSSDGLTVLQYIIMANNIKCLKFILPQIPLFAFKEEANMLSWLPQNKKAAWMEGDLYRYKARLTTMPCKCTTHYLDYDKDLCQAVSVMAAELFSYGFADKYRAESTWCMDFLLEIAPRLAMMKIGEQDRTLLIHTAMEKKSSFCEKLAETAAGQLEMRIHECDIKETLELAVTLPFGIDSFLKVLNHVQKNQIKGKRYLLLRLLLAWFTQHTHSRTDIKQILLYRDDCDRSVIQMFYGTVVNILSDIPEWAKSWTDVSEAVPAVTKALLNLGVDLTESVGDPIFGSALDLLIDGCNIFHDYMFINDDHFQYVHGDWHYRGHHNLAVPSPKIVVDKCLRQLLSCAYMIIMTTKSPREFSLVPSNERDFRLELVKVLEMGLESDSILHWHMIRHLTNFFMVNMLQVCFRLCNFDKTACLRCEPVNRLVFNTMYRCKDITACEKKVERTLLQSIYNGVLAIYCTSKLNKINWNGRCAHCEVDCCYWTLFELVGHCRADLTSVITTPRASFNRHYFNAVYLLDDMNLDESLPYLPHFSTIVKLIWMYHPISNGLVDDVLTKTHARTQKDVVRHTVAELQALLHTVRPLQLLCRLCIMEHVQMKDAQFLPLPPKLQLYIQVGDISSTHPIHSIL